MHRSFRIAAAARSAAIALRGGHGRVAIADVEAEWNSQVANQAPPAPETTVIAVGTDAVRVDGWEGKPAETRGA
jgi:hypothetical protein